MAYLTSVRERTRHVLVPLTNTRQWLRAYMYSTSSTRKWVPGVPRLSCDTPTCDSMSLVRFLCLCCAHNSRLMSCCDLAGGGGGSAGAGGLLSGSCVCAGLMWPLLPWPYCCLRLARRATCSSVQPLSISATNSSVVSSMGLVLVYAYVWR